jgi:predicted metalloendopeptidase
MTRTALRGLAAALAALAATAHAKLDVAGIDRTVDACTSFYQYANSSWITATPIPADRARWSTFEIIDQRNEKVLLDTIEKATKSKNLGGYAPKSPEWRAIRYYQSGMDLNRIKYWALGPLRGYFDRTDVKDAAAIAGALGFLHASGFPAGFNFEVDPDRKDSTRYIVEITQGGLGLPERDYYFREDDKTAKQRVDYRKHVTQMFRLLGDSDEQATRNAAAVFGLETELARASMTAVERRDVEKTYNKMTVAELQALAPGLPWRQYFDALGAKDLATLNVSQPEFFKAVARLAAERPADWQAYLRWHVVHAAATKLPPAFEEEHFDFYERNLRGVQTPPPRHRTVLRTMGGPYGEQGIGMALGKLFVDAAFPPEAKKRALDLVNNVKAALADRLKASPWMTEETRRASLEKLAGMDVKIGYPDKWRDFTGARMGEGAFVENWIYSNQFDHRRFVARIGKPVDRSEWLISPHVVNAYYNPTSNEIVFLAGILQPPYFDAKADDAVNYGGIGMVIGHEITHGFDDRGRRFDKDGNLRDWWTADDAKRYEERARVIEAQYSAMDGVDGVKPNGKLTLGENIADVGGLKIAYDALQKALKGKPRTKIDGLTPEQRFFLSFAQAWRTVARAEFERNSLLTYQHSLPRFRVNGPVSHLPEFAQAFSCDPKRSMLPDAATSAIW